MGKNERAFSLVELIMVLLVVGVFATAAAIQLNRAIEDYDLTRLTSEIVGRLETVRAECSKQSDSYPAAALSVTSDTATRAYALQFYYRDPATNNIVHSDRTYDLFTNFVLSVDPSIVTYTFNPRGKALAYGSVQYTTTTPPLATLPPITVRHRSRTGLSRTINVTLAGNISVQ
jgi:prepilin-type N-terminal cleavage/methylation domain-containing protein